MKPTQCIYSPKSKIHVDLGWQSLFLQELRCAGKFNVLIRIIHSTDNANSVYADSSGIEHPGMLINYSYLSDALCLSRSTLQRILNQLEADGYISRIKLGRGKVLAQATHKSCDLRDEIHAGSLAAKTNSNDFHKLSNNFEVVYTQQKEIPGQFNLTASKNKVGQFDRAASQELSRVGQIDRALLNEVKVKEKNNNLNNQYQVLEAVTEFENSDCLTVVFYFDEFSLGEIHAEEDLFDYFTVAQSKILNTIVYCYAESLDINLFNETLARQDLRKEAQNFRQLVDWAYATAMGNQEKVSTKIKIASNDLTKVTISAKEPKPVPNSNTVDLMEAFQVCGTDHQGVSDEASTTQTDSNCDSEVGYNTAQRDHDIKSALQQSLPSNVNTGNVDLDMPVIEKEVLRKDWISLADQNFYQGTLPDSQKIALVAIIDYVKRKGIVIGSDQEIYRWLYHTASNHRHYYSRAMNFKHLANILIKQLMNRRFERPSGFNVWEQRVKQQIGCSKMSLSKRE